MMTQKFSRFRHFLKGTAVVFGALALTVTAPRDARAAKDAQLEPAQMAVVQKVGDYFNKVTNLQGEFIQVGPAAMSPRVFSISASPASCGSNIPRPIPF